LVRYVAIFFFTCIKDGEPTATTLRRSGAPLSGVPHGAEALDANHPLWSLRSDECIASMDDVTVVCHRSDAPVNPTECVMFRLAHLHHVDVTDGSLPDNRLVRRLRGFVRAAAESGELASGRAY
jgi:hypothetical protein